MNHFEETNCGDVFCKDVAIAMAYVPWQHFRQTFEPQKALMVGTVFPELCKPFIGKPGGMRR